MDIKIIIALVVLLAAVVLGGVLIASPSPSGSPFVSEKVKVTLPFPGATVLKEFIVTGEARGVWFFEASFPVEVRDSDGNVVGRGIAQANGEWMTEEHAPISAPVTIVNYSGPARLLLIKDNPSGLPDHDDSVSFPVVVQLSSLWFER